MASDSEFVKRLLEGDQTVWNDWDWRICPVLARIAQCEFHLAQEETEDLLQDLAVALLSRDGHRLRTYQGRASLRSWLYIVWRRRCLDFRRQQRAGAPRTSRQELVRADTFDRRLLATEALAFVNAHDRRLLQLHSLQGWSYKEISARLNVSENAIGPSVARAKERLKNILAAPARNSSSDASSVMLIS